ncbi:MAG: sulfotransferase [Acetobacteraceae bacterium]|nr:sulfotransferase [Acetobacteraceae bacterium]
MAEHPKILIGASIPRSGHHFLARLLKEILREDLHYCEFYTPPGCCKRIPCTKRTGAALIYQKQHDRKGEVPQDVARALYVVQHRHPIPQALSDRELNLADAPARQPAPWRRSRAYHEQWLAAQGAYVRRFHDRWIAAGPPNAIRIAYERLSAEPEAVLAELLEAAGLPPRPERIAEAVAAVRPVRVSGVLGAPHRFTPRRIEDSPAFEPDLHGAYEDWLLPRIPAFGFSRMVPEGRIAGHPLAALLLLTDTREALPDGETDRLSAAARIAPGHPAIEMLLADRERRGGEPAAAFRRLLALAERAPYWAPLWPRLFQLAEQLRERVPAALLTGEAMVTLSGEPQVLLRGAAALLREYRATEALAAIAIAAEFLPPEATGARAEAHLLRSSALLMLRDRRRALAEAEAAHALDPENPRVAAALERARTAAEDHAGKGRA